MPLPICSIMTNKELFNFTGNCLSLDEHPDFSKVIIQLIESDSIDWQDFVQQCSGHLILPIIYLKFLSHKVLPQLPEALSEFLKEIYELNLLRNEQILEQIHAINKILNENKIYPTYLKGAGNLLDHLYKDLGERMMGDIDLLVDEKDYLPAAKLLEKDGYAVSTQAYIDIKSLKHYPRLNKPGYPASVEVHRIPVREEYSKSYNTAIINKEKREIKSHGSCFVLSDNHKVIHLFIHAQLSDKGNASGKVSFRDLYDLYRLSKRIPMAQIIPHIPYKRKAIAYFVFAGNTLNLPKHFYPTEPLAARLFALKHELNLKSATFSTFNRLVLFMNERIFEKYLRQIVMSFYSYPTRRSLYKRLSNPLWYKDHLNLYIRFFFPDK